MEDQQSTTAAPKSYQVIGLDDNNQTVEGMLQEQVNPDGSVANTNQDLNEPPSTAFKEPRSKKAFQIGLRKLNILLWKNCLLRRRAWILLTFELLFLAGLCALLIALIGSPQLTKKEKATVPTEFTEEDMIGNFAIVFDGKHILYTALDPAAVQYANNIVARIATELANRNTPPNIIWTSVSSPSNSEKEVGDAFIAAKVQNIDVWCAVVFTAIITTPTVIEMKYKIRMTNDTGVKGSGGPFGKDERVHSKTTILFAEEDEDSPPGPNMVHQRAYIEAGILGLQILIDDAAVKVLSNPIGFKRKVTLKTFPYPEHYVKDKEPTFNVFCYVFAIVIIFSNAFLAMNIGSEKDTGVKELMKLCGYPGWMQWLAWYLIPFLMDFVIFLMMVFLFKWVPSGIRSTERPVFAKSDISVVLILLLLSKISNNAFVFFISSLMKSTACITASAIILPVLITMFFTGQLQYIKSFSGQIGWMILPNVCFVVALRHICRSEGYDKGAQWSLLTEPLPNIPKMNLGHIILMFLMDIVVYQALAVYFGSVLANEYGVKKPWYYPLRAIIAPVMAIKRKKGIPAPSQMSVAPTESKAGAFEPYQGHDKAIGVDIHNLVKIFDKHKIAVNGVSLKMYDGQIFALLGHNGAGKTTLISMLTGMFTPTSGTASVGGYDITREMDKVRQNLGLCPQHDMLFNNVTVMEHLQMFGQMKGQSSLKVREEAMSLLKIMNLSEKKDTFSKKLSGGQKRKLCLGMALIGNAKVVILDEPTSGMDPEARRAIWDILLQVRGQRTVLLTTHFMEEADVLGDRIGIMAEGKLQCCGSPSYLKWFYGTGYTLKVSLLPGGDKSGIIALVQKNIPDATLKPIHMPNEIFIALPTEKTNSSTLSALFLTLTEKKEEMLIESLGLSVASMDEIFVKVGELSGKAAVAKEEIKPTPTSQSSVPNQNHLKQDHESTKSVITTSKVPSANATTTGGVSVSVVENKISSSVAPSKKTHAKLKGFVIIVLRQTVAILVKRFICSKRKYGYLLFQLLFLPFVMLCIVGYINDIIKPGPLPPPLDIALSGYKNPVVFYSDNQGQIPSANEAMKSSTVKEVTNVEAALMSAGISDIFSFRENVIVAGEVISEDNYTAWFNTVPLHAAPLAINLASNIRGRKFDPPIKFHVTNHPLKTRSTLLIENVQKVLSNSKDAQYASHAGTSLGWFSYCLVFVALGFVILPTEERLNKSRQLQFMTGINPIVYWTVYYLWDFVLILILATVISLIPVLAGNYKIFSSSFGILFLIMLIFGYSLIPLAYMVSTIPKSVAGGIFVDLVFLIVPLILDLILVDLWPRGSIMLMAISPINGIREALYFAGLGSLINGRCNFLGKDEKDMILSSASTSSGPLDVNLVFCAVQPPAIIVGGKYYSTFPFFKWEMDMHEKLGKNKDVTHPGIGQLLTWTSVNAIACQALHIAIELGVFRFLRSLLINAKQSDFLDQVDDADVSEEKQRVAEMVLTKNMSSDALVVDTLCKNFGPFSAVSKLTFGVHHGECFGLLGTNGAGKTTTFRIITGDEVKSFGNAYADRFTLNKNRRKFISQIGYCPQFDAFIPYFTGKENLQLFARLRGVPWSQVNREADKWLARVGLTESGKVRSKKYSGGMKRRLSAAIAMIGDPSLILLDEPTSGVDPVSRRQFWQVLESVKGVQHLKHKFAQGYSLTLRLKPPQNAFPNMHVGEMLIRMNQEICEKFHPCVLKDQHETLLQYQIENTSIGWNVIYNTLEDLKKLYADIVEDYSVGETTLEEVFLAFSRRQYPPRESKVKLWKRILTCQF